MYLEQWDIRAGRDSHQQPLRIPRIHVVATIEDIVGAPRTRARLIISLLLDPRKAEAERLRVRVCPDDVAAERGNRGRRGVRSAGKQVDLVPASTATPQAVADADARIVGHDLAQAIAQTLPIGVYPNAHREQHGQGRRQPVEGRWRWRWWPIPARMIEGVERRAAK